MTRNTAPRPNRSRQSAASAVQDLRRAVDEHTHILARLAAQMETIAGREADLQQTVIQTRDMLLRRQDGIWASLYDLHNGSAEPPQAPLASVGDDRAAPSDDRASYRQLIRQIREVVRANLPPDARIIVVSKGDDDLLDLYGRPAWHFPRATDGRYAGFYPANSTAAIVQLEVLRSHGGEFLLFPRFAMWWLDHYSRFRQHLEGRYQRVAQDQDACAIFALRQPPTSGSAAEQVEFEHVIAECQSRLDRDPTILDWNTRSALARSDGLLSIFSPPAPARVLPYLDHSVDIVALAASDSESAAEARRVAREAVVSLGNGHDGAGHSHLLAVAWKSDKGAVGSPTTSIVIPCFNGAPHTEACLTSLWDTLPRDFQGEIIVVDDSSTDETPALLKRCSRRDKRLKVLRNRKNVGFVGSCNRGAKAATGDIIVFLNNDTILLPRWLPPLWRMFRDYADAGAVGGKLIFPDGTLQEAGGVVFCDGSAANFGRGDHAVDAPMYNFVREVDYCSAALMATRRSLFQALGGFDPRFRPGYYEDTDYCFRLRQEGCRVYYQPESAVIHREGATAGTDLTSGVKQWQVINQAKFLEKWNHALRRQPPRPEQFDFAAWHALVVRQELDGLEAP